ncbi:S1 RNA-binding domain-containing protein [Neobacillus citreus]|uniref:S1-like domain-containing RNA-binding protein n=1 Tax=Neobacillus citreus TaxID=2833578 RepID=A0A942SWJ6_9BACI|nr:S1-like domain-containing RNA-binding protein [Neobacillus citreus]MCH6265227.1 S1-like domain-containing RNA-binding protein [Neobacillus citreus]
MAIKELIGQTTTLTVARQAEFGYFLTDGEEDVLLHNNEVNREVAEGDEIEVFIYVDSQGRPAASTTIPEVAVGRYAWIKVTDVKEEIGVFLNIGLKKDILLGAEDLPVHKSVWPREGDMVYITLRVNRNNLLYAKLASDQVIQSIAVKASRQEFNKNVQGYIYRTAKVGSWLYTIEGFKGFIHESQRRIEPRLGEKVEGRVIDVKEDGTINVSLLARKQESQDSDAAKLYEYLMSRNGAMPYSDKSMPEDIQERFGLSKAAFKRALGKLIKEGKVYQEDFWTYVKKE